MLRARNYSWAIFVGVVILASIWYLVSGREAFRERLRHRDEACLQAGNDPLTYNGSLASKKEPSGHIRSREEAA
jgi:hypothetical protein